MSLSTLLQPAVALYDALLQPVFAPNPLLNFVGVYPEKLSALDWLATVRLCVALRQIRIAERASIKGKGSANESFVKDALATLTVVFGGEIIASPFLLIPPSFMTSPSTSVIFSASQYLIDTLPASLIPTPALTSELPLALLDGFSRAFLLCSAVPPAVLHNAVPAIQQSVWALALTSFLIANAGFALCGTFSLFSPAGVSVRTPPELLPYGWAAADLWVAPLVSVLYAVLTVPGGVYGEVRTAVAQNVLGYGVEEVILDEKVVAGTVGAFEADEVRAAMAVGLAVLFSGRAIKNFYVYAKKY